MDDYPNDYTGRHWPTTWSDRAAAIDRCLYRDGDAQHDGYHYQPRHSAAHRKEV